MIAELEEAIAADRMFKDITSDAQYIVRELELPVDEKKPPVMITLTDKDKRTGKPEGSSRPATKSMA